MLRTKGGYISKPSKASLKSRGLSSNAVRTRRLGSSASSVDGRFSLYSTDSEDNVAGLNKGLDKCAQLLTNILEVNAEKGGPTGGTRPQPLSKLRQRKVAVHKTKNSTGHQSKASANKLTSKNPIPKRRDDIQIPTTKTQINHEEPLKYKPSYNKKVVASTPVLTADQRQRQQELQEKENVLQKQINVLQQQYDDLQKATIGQHVQDPNSKEPPADGNQAFKNTVPEDKESALSRSPGNRSVRRSLEFTTNAEKPFIDNPDENNPSSPHTTAGNTDKNIVKPTGHEPKKRVRIAQQDGCDIQKKNSEATKFSCHDCGDGTPGVPQHDSKRGTSTRMVNLRNGTPQKNTDHLRILFYLVGELKSVLENSEDVEVERLLMEIENEIRLLSYPVQSPVPTSSGKKACKQHDIDTEVALQPLRSENSDLRRKLRIANQRLRETENQCRQNQEKPRPTLPNEGLIESLHNQLLKEREQMAKEKQQKELVEKKLSENIQEQKRTLFNLSEKEDEVIKIKDDLQREKEKSETAISQLNVELESNAIRLRAKEKEIALLNLALKQRDTEIERLTELTRGLQQSLTKVLSNVQGLYPDNAISDVSSLHSFLDSYLHPPGLKAADLSSLTASSNNELYHDHMDHQVEYRQAREYDGNKRDVCGPSVCNGDNYEQLVYGISSPGVKQQDSMSSLSSSAEESTFKLELANLDTAIARLQDNLRGKL